METKGVKFDNKFFQQKVTLTVSEKLNALDLKELAPKKQEIANRQLEKIKDFLPKR